MAKIPTGHMSPQLTTEVSLQLCYHPIHKWIRQSHNPHHKTLVDHTIPDSKVHGAYMGPTWGRQDPGGPHVGPMNLATRDCATDSPRDTRFALCSSLSASRPQCQSGTTRSFAMHNCKMRSQTWQVCNCKSSPQHTGRLLGRLDDPVVLLNENLMPGYYCRRRV